MRLRRYVGVLVTGLVLGSVVGCSSSATTSDPTEAPTQSAVVHTGDLTAAEATALLAGLEVIDPGLNHERSIRRAERICDEIKNPQSSDGLNAYVEAEFEGGTVPELSPDQVEAIVSVVHLAFCDAR
jgi:hypothetical protein